MPKTKLPKNAIGTGAVDTNKIENTAVRNLEFADGTITGSNLEDPIDLSGKTLTLPNTSVTADNLASTLDLSGKTITLPNGTVTADNLANTLDLSSKTVTLPTLSVTNAMLAGSIENAKLSNNSITVNGGSLSLGSSLDVALTADWQSVKTSSFTAVAGEGYFVNTTSSAITVTLPSSPSLGDFVQIKDYAGTFATNNLTIARNGNNIQGVANDSLITINRASLILVYVDASKGWLYTDEHNVGDLQAATFI